MSFGFSIGDFLTVFEHANKLRKRFINAPAQFHALSEQYVPLKSLKPYVGLILLTARLLDFVTSLLWCRTKILP